MRNTGAGAARLLRARSSCGCLPAEFRPCSLAPGQETTLALTVPANSVSGEFRKTLFLETAAPGQEFLTLTVSGTAVPAVEVQPKREAYLMQGAEGKSVVRAVDFGRCATLIQCRLSFTPSPSSRIPLHAHEYPFPY